MIPVAELGALVDNIKAFGLENPIVLLDGKLLDGRNRLLACLKAGVAPRFVEWQRSGDPMEWVLSQNLHRRHLEPSQRAALAYEVKGYYAKAARARMESGINQHSPTTKLQDPSKGEAAQHAAERFGVSPTYVFEAGRIFRASPSTFQKLKAGVVTLQEAKREVEGGKRLAESGFSTVPMGTPSSRWLYKFLDHLSHRVEFDPHTLSSNELASVIRQVEVFRDELEAASSKVVSSG